MKKGLDFQSACVLQVVGHLPRWNASETDIAVWSSEIPLEKVHNLADLEGKTMKEELGRIGYLGDLKCSYEVTPLSAHL